jgi:hypothetical protein
MRASPTISNILLVSGAEASMVESGDSSFAAEECTGQDACTPIALRGFHGNAQQTAR